MLLNSARIYKKYTQKVLARMMESPWAFSSFIALSVISALTEGLSITLLVPILDAQTMGNSFSDVPVFKYVSDFFATMSAREKLLYAAGLLFIVVVLRGILNFTTQVLSIAIPIKTQGNLMSTVYKDLLSVEMEYFNSLDIGDHLHSVVDRPVRIASVLKASADAIVLVFILVIYTILMLSISWELTLLSVLVMLFFMWCMKLISQLPVKKLGHETAGIMSRFNQTLYETLEGMLLVRLKSADRKMIDRFSYDLSEKLRIQQSKSIYDAIPGPFITTAVGVFICLLLYVGTLAAEGSTQELTSKIILFMFLLMRLMGPVSGLSSCRNTIQANIVALDEADSFSEEVRRRAQIDGTIEFPGLISDIKFNDVQHVYTNMDEPAVRSVSLSIKAGEMVAVIGPSGAGKSTLVGLLSRIYNPTQGEILIDGVNLSDLVLASWRKKISVVSQDIVLFNGSVEQNIAFGMDDVSPNEVHAAAKMAAADAFIQELPEGYNTNLGDRGVRLSGGQKQRIAIARAILSDPDLLIMDEGTSHLDSVTEKEIQAAVEKLSQRCTILVIAHRLSTVRRADKIVVMEQGQIVEEGRHDDLIAQKGAYWNLLTHQKLDMLDEQDEECASPV